ncbi:MAG: hypothetical protein K8I65_16490 [Thermoanaerobaculia bacterium]|nr:hypothetical protein [Thermoanaerobaculia bacterium]
MVAFVSRRAAGGAPEFVEAAREKQPRLVRPILDEPPDSSRDSTLVKPFISRQAFP